MCTASSDKEGAKAATGFFGRGLCAKGKGRKPEIRIQILAAQDNKHIRLSSVLKIVEKVLMRMVALGAMQASEHQKCGSVAFLLVLIVIQ